MDDPSVVLPHIAKRLGAYNKGIHTHTNHNITLFTSKYSQGAPWIFQELPVTSSTSLEVVGWEG